MNQRLQNSAGFGRGGGKDTPKRSRKQPKTLVNPGEREQIQQAITLLKQDQHKEAEAIFQRLIAGGAHSHMVYGNLAVACGAQGKVDELINHLRTALEIKADYPEAHNNLGFALHEKGHFIEAINHLQEAIRLKPGYGDAFNNLGNSLRQIGKIDEAIGAYNRCLELKPDSAETYNNKGVALQESGMLESSIKAYEKAISIRASYAEPYFHKGTALAELGRFEEAADWYLQGLALQPDAAEWRKTLGMARLMLGDYEKGWLDYEKRLVKVGMNSTLHAQPNSSRWRGEDLPEKQRLLVVSEQGLGDIMQFMRYVKVLNHRGIRTNLCAPEKLDGLIKQSGIDAAPLKPDEAKQISDGAWVPLASLPMYLKVNPVQPLLTEPYIKTDPALVKRWREKLRTEKKPIIGINWQGNPDHEKLLSRGRSMPLEALAPIARQHPGSFVSLQKGHGSEQLERCSFRDQFVTCQEEISAIWDFVESAAIIANCDLIISSDTATAHLAGGMGKTTWLLLKKVPEWRWGLQGNKSFWYPNMQLFRQTESGDWQTLAEQVGIKIKQRIPTSLADNE
jgi:tetratricopeptide (TPR) repeat protein